MTQKSVFRSAIEGDDGRVDAGYLGAFFVMVVVVGSIPFMCIFSGVSMFLDPAHKFDVQALGTGIGAVCVGFGTAIGAVGLFRMGDKPHAGTTMTSVTATEKTVTPT